MRQAAVVTSRHYPVDEVADDPTTSESRLKFQNRFDKSLNYIIRRPHGGDVLQAIETCE